MDPVITAIIAALSTGSASGISDVTKKAIAESYEGLKALLKKRFGASSAAADAIEKLQAKPDSPGRQQTLTEELKAINASAEPELLAAAQSLLKLVKAVPHSELHIQIAHGTGIAQAGGESIAAVTISKTTEKKTHD